MVVHADQWLVIQAQTKAGSHVHKINNLLAIYKISLSCLEYEPDDQEIFDVFVDTETTLRIFVNTGVIRSSTVSDLKERAEFLHSKKRPA